MKIIVIGDSHAKPLWFFTQNKDGHQEKKLFTFDIANRRYDWLALFILDIIQTLDPGEELVIIDMGDFCDMKSLSSYDIGKRPSENERIQLDLDYSQDARRRLTQPILEYIEQLRKRKKRIPKIRFIALLGNHENRWERLKKDEALWDLFNGISDISLAGELGWEVYPFLVPVCVENIYFCHYFESGARGFAIGGVSPGRALLLKLRESVVTAHSHEWHIHRESTVLSTKIAMVAGAYFEHYEDYAGPQGNPRWWKGITVLENVQNGAYNEVKYPMDAIKQKYYRPEQGPWNLEDMGKHV